MEKYYKNLENKIIRDNIPSKIHLLQDGEILCGYKKPSLSNELNEWETKGVFQCQKCRKKYERLND